MKTENFSIIPFSSEYKNQILKIEADCFSCRVLETCFDDYLSKEYFYGYSIVNSEEVCGYICYNVLYDFAEIIDVAIKGNYRQKHLGSTLMEHLISHATKENLKSIVLEVRAQNSAAIKLYEKYGFKVDRIVKSYYKNPTDDGLCMSLIL